MHKCKIIRYIKKKHMKLLNLCAYWSLKFMVHSVLTKTRTFSPDTPKADELAKVSARL